MTLFIFNISRKQFTPLLTEDNYRYALLSLIISSILFPFSAFAAPEQFNPEALNLGIEDQVADINSLDYLSYEGAQLPGVYTVDIFINSKLMDTRQVRFIFDDEQKKLFPELTKQDLLNWGVKESASDIFSRQTPAALITDITRVIPSANTQYDFSRGRLSIFIPQIAIYNYGRGYIPPSEWNDGINAAFVNYNYRQSRYWYSDQENSDNIFLGLRSGINISAWRLRNNSNYAKASRRPSQWNSLQTYAEHDIRWLKSRVTIGETASAGDILESIPYRGLKLASDENMLPQSQRGFAPVVRGIAQSNAVVTIRQNNSIIYQTSVPPGEFEISDLYPTAYSGDLQVTVEEASGEIRTFYQPFSSVPMMQRAGGFKYSVDLGKYHSSRAVRKPLFFQASGIYGLPYNLSLYGGSILSANYQSYALGAGVNLGYIGAISADITHASATPYNQERAQGQAYRLQYSKYLIDTRTSFSLASYRYSTKNYYEFNDTNNYLDGYYHKKGRLQFSLSQSLGDIGSIALNGYQQDYWSQGGIDRNINLSFNSSINTIQYNISYAYNKTKDSESTDQMLSFNVSIPFTTSNFYWLNYRYNSSKRGDSISSLSFNGTLLEDSNLQYDISQNYNHSNKEYSSSISGDYRASSGEISASYNYDKRYQSLNWGANGALIIHQGGIIPSRTIYDSAIIVKAEGVDNLKINNGQGLYTNAQGYAVIPNSIRYQQNRVSVDTSTLQGNSDVEMTSTIVTPTKGAIILTDFKAKKGARVLATLNYNGEVLPFGTQVELYQEGRVVAGGIVANDGEVFLSGVPEQSQLRVKWGNSAAERCEVPLTIDLSIDNIQALALDCR